jgi:hypothetical protein
VSREPVRTYSCMTIVKSGTICDLRRVTVRLKNYVTIAWFRGFLLCDRLQVSFPIFIHSSSQYEAISSSIKCSHSLMVSMLLLIRRKIRVYKEGINMSQNCIHSKFISRPTEVVFHIGLHARLRLVVRKPITSFENSSFYNSAKAERAMIVTRINETLKGANSVHFYRNAHGRKLQVPF